MTNWDKIALTRWGTHLIETEKVVVSQAIQLAGQPDHGVDVGCGSGRWSKLASEAGWRMTCLDVDQPALDTCRQNVPNAEFVLTEPDGRTLPCQSNSAGLMLCIEVGPVIESDWFASEAGRILRDQGILVTVGCNRHSWRGMACRLKYWLTKSRDAESFYNHSYADRKADLEAAGFQIVHEHGFCWSPITRSSNSRLVPFFLWLEKCLLLDKWVTWSPWVALIARKKPSP